MTRDRELRENHAGLLEVSLRRPEHHVALTWREPSFSFTYHFYPGLLAGMKLNVVPYIQRHSQAIEAGPKVGGGGGNCYGHRFEH